MAHQNLDTGVSVPLADVASSYDASGLTKGKSAFDCTTRESTLHADLASGALSSGVLVGAAAAREVSVAAGTAEGIDTTEEVAEEEEEVVSAPDPQLEAELLGAVTQTFPPQYVAVTTPEERKEHGRLLLRWYNKEEDVGPNAQCELTEPLAGVLGAVRRLHVVCSAFDGVQV